MKNNIIYPAVIGTLAMTAFSRLVSRKKHKDFVESSLLSKLIKKLPTDNDNKEAGLAGTALHYLTGIGFVMVYDQLWKNNIVKPSLASGAAIGAVSGLCGVAVWETALEMHPDPPLKKKKNYFGHLVLAHIVFGVFATATYKLLGNEKTGH